MKTHTRQTLIAPLITAVGLLLILGTTVSGPRQEVDPKGESVKELPYDEALSIPGLVSQPLQPALPETTALLNWKTRFDQSSPDARTALEQEGVLLAQARHARMAHLIRTAPAAALAAALPSRQRSAAWPAALQPWLETPVSARAALAVLQSCFHPPGQEPANGGLFRATVIENQEYRVHVYGSRLSDPSLPDTSLIGIAIGRDLAVSEARFRVLSANEPLPPGVKSGPPGSVVVEAEGQVTVLESQEALAAFSANLLARERPVQLMADSGPGSSGVVGRPAQSSTHGSRRVAVLRVDFSDLPGTPINHSDGNAVITPAYLDQVLNGPAGVRAFLQSASYGKTDLLFNSSTDVSPVLRMPNTASSYAVAGNSQLLHTHARAAAATAGINLTPYERVIVVFSSLSNLPGSQITYGGLASRPGTDTWVNGSFDLRVVAHELGHNFGLWHSNLWQVTDGNPVSAAGTTLEYGDPFDLMGSGTIFEHDFSLWNKSLLRWIPDAAVTLAAADGTYRIYQFDNPGADLMLPRGLKVIRDRTQDYWIGYRRAPTTGTTVNGAYVLWGANTMGRGQLLDMVTPNADATNAPLPLGQTFHDTAGGVSFRPVAQGGSGTAQWLDVQVNFQPRLQWAQASFLANEQGGSAVLTVTRANQPAGAVSVNYSTSPGTALAPADFTNASGTLTWPAGDMTPRTISVPVVADALVEGTETFTITLTAATGGAVVVDNPAAVVSIVDPGSMDTRFMSEFINGTVNRVLPLADGNVLIAGWFDLLQDDSFNQFAYGRVARLTSSGKIDSTFNPGSGANAVIHAMAMQPDGKILIGGDFTSFNGTSRNRLARLNPDGTLDLTFNPGSGADAVIYDLVVQPDGRLLVGGNFTTWNGTARNRLVRLQADGSLDSTLANPAWAGSSVRGLALQADGRILAGGSIYYLAAGGTGFKSGIVRLLADGTRDASFDVGYGAATSSSNSTLTAVRSLVVLPDQRVIVGGTFTGFGGSPRSRLARLSSTGTLDPGFAPAANGTVAHLSALPDGSVLAAGEFTVVDSVTVAGVARLRADGSVDAAFAAAGGLAEPVTDLALQADGTVLLTGNVAAFQGSTDERPVWRLVPGLSGLPGTIQWSTDAYSAPEGDSVTLTASRTGGSLGALTVGYAAVPGTAGLTDFTPVSGVLTWADGETASKSVTVSLTTDTLSDAGESFTVNLGDPLIGGAVLGTQQQATVIIESPAGFVTWLAGYFSTTELTNSAISGDLADPDGDGLPNLMEYSFGLLPRQASRAGAPTAGTQTTGGQTYATVTFRRRVPAGDLTYTVEAAGSLNGTWDTNAVLSGTPVSQGDGTETVTFRDTIPVPGATRRFLRVRVSR